MSTITSTNDSLGFMSKSARAEAMRPSFLATVKAVLEAMDEGLSAARRYKELTAQGVAPDAAARRVFVDHFETR